MKWFEQIDLGEVLLQIYNHYYNDNRSDISDSLYHKLSDISGEFVKTVLYL